MADASAPSIQPLNALVLFKTRSMDAALARLSSKKLEIPDEAVARLSPFLHHHINVPVR
nr:MULTISPECIES: Tn3 family transposase [Streptomyces]